LNFYDPLICDFEMFLICNSEKNKMLYFLCVEQWGLLLTFTAVCRLCFSPNFLLTGQVCPQCPQSVHQDTLTVMLKGFCGGREPEEMQWIIC
jgi:hypothetical protein